MNNLTAVSKLTYRNLTHLSVSSYLILSYLIQVDSVSEEEHDATEAPVPLVGDLAARV